MLNKIRQVIIIGGTGQIGHRTVEALVTKGFTGTIVATSRDVRDGLPAGPLGETIVGLAREWKGVHWKKFDLEADPETIKEQLAGMDSALTPNESTLLILAAAFTNVDGCETDPEKCRRINEANTLAVLYWARNRYKAKLVFYSTDYVFDGAAGPYAETAKRRAISVYGQSKVAVEEWLERNAPDSLILRTTGVYDWIPGSKNFVMQMVEMWRAGKRARLPSDQIANPIWSGDIVRATLELVEKNQSGHFGVAGGTWLSRTEFGDAIGKAFDVTPVYDAITTADLAQKAKRPLKGGLAIDKLERTLGWKPMAALEGLKFIRKNFSKD